MDDAACRARLERGRHRRATSSASSIGSARRRAAARARLRPRTSIAMKRLPPSVSSPCSAAMFRMVEQGEQARFAFEAREALGVLGERFRAAP